jgi:capsule polysaccharide modification protein KpsS
MEFSESAKRDTNFFAHELSVRQEGGVKCSFAYPCVRHLVYHVIANYAEADLITHLLRLYPHPDAKNVTVIVIEDESHSSRAQLERRVLGVHLEVFAWYLSPPQSNLVASL